MKSIFIFIGLLTGAISFGQKQKESKPYQIKVIHTNKAISMGFLIDMSDTTLTLVTREGQVLPAIQYNQIKKIKVRHSNSVKRGLAVGACVGFTVGAFYTIAVVLPACTVFYCTFPAILETVALVGFINSVQGAFFGLLIGSLYQDYKIGSSLEKFTFARPELLKYLWRPDDGAKVHIGQKPD